MEKTLTVREKFIIQFLSTTSWKNVFSILENYIAFLRKEGLLLGDHDHHETLEVIRIDLDNLVKKGVVYASTIPNSQDFRLHEDFEIIMYLAQSRFMENIQLPNITDPIEEAIKSCSHHLIGRLPVSKLKQLFEIKVTKKPFNEVLVEVKIKI